MDLIIFTSIKIPKVFHCIQGHECIYAFDAKLIFRIAIKWMKQHRDMASLSVCTWIENSFQVCIGLILLLTFARNRIASKHTITTSLFLFWKKKKTTFFLYIWLLLAKLSECIAKHTPNHMPFWRFPIWHASAHVVSSLQCSILLNLPLYSYQFGVFTQCIIWLCSLAKKGKKYATYA